MQDRYLSLFFTSGQSQIDVPKFGILMENHQNSFLFFSLRMRLFFVLHSSSSYASLEHHSYQHKFHHNTFEMEPYSSELLKRTHPGVPDYLH